MLIQQEYPLGQDFGDSATWERLLTESQNLIAFQDLNSLLQRIPETAGTVLGADIVILYEYREETDDVNLPPMIWGDIRYPKILTGKGIIRPHRESAVFKMLDKRRRKPIYASNAQEDWRSLIGVLSPEQKGGKTKDFALRENIVSSAAVSLRADSERVGVLFVNYHSHHAFPKDERKAIELFASQAAIAIQNARLFQMEHERAKAMAFLQQVTAEISASLDETETLALIINGAMQLLGMDSGVIHLVDEAKQAVIRSYEAPPNFGHPVPRFSEKKGKTWWVVNTGNMVVAPDITHDGSIHPGMSQMNVRAVLAAPLKVEGKVIGVLSLNDSNLHKFTEYEKTLLTMLADHAAIAIQNARLFQMESERAKAMALLQQVTAKISASLDETETLALIINGAMQLLGMDSGVIHLVDEAKQAVIRSYEAPPNFGHPVPRFSEKKGKTWWVVNTGNMVVAPDITHDGSIHPGMSQMNVRAVLAAPLKVEGKVIGVLSLNDSNLHKFTEYEKMLLTMLADYAAITIHNARELRRGAELAAIGQSATAMAHRMKTPLQDIRLTSELLREELQKLSTIPEARLQDFKDITRRVDQMAEAIDRVRDAARQLKPVYSPHDIGEIIKSSFTENRSFAEQLAKRKIRAELRGLGEIENRSIECDRGLIEEAISNLVANALEAVKDGGLIQVCVSQVNNDFHIEVQDDGLGINQNVLSRASLFEPFKTTKKGGLGLGLYIVRRNVEAHGGSANYYKTSRGSCFRIEIPRKGHQEN